MKTLMLALFIISLLSFGCATTGNLYLENLYFKCSDCYNQDSVKTAVNIYFDKKNSHEAQNFNYKIDCCSENEEFWFVGYSCHNSPQFQCRGGAYELKISKKLCKIVKVTVYPG
ncbi:MAG: hypothetical protein WCR42_07620 [bacterium]